MPLVGFLEYPPVKTTAFGGNRFANCSINLLFVAICFVAYPVDLTLLNLFFAHYKHSWIVSFPGPWVRSRT
jgi:hypothetical protein